MDDFVPVEGRAVVVKIADGVWRPAQIVRVWTPQTLNLVVFTDGSNDDSYDIPNRERGSLSYWLTSTTRGENVRQWQPRVPDTDPADVT